MALIGSCSSQSQSTQETQAAQVIDHSPIVESKVDTSLLLKLSSGIRAILEDSKGNTWFGSHQEGVAKFDGKKLTYFTTVSYTHLTLPTTPYV